MEEQEKILIIKTGATGDVVRTTCILRAFRNASITWLTHASCIPLFDNDNKQLLIFPIDEFPDSILTEMYDLVLSLEEDEYCARLASQLHSKKITGVYWNDALVYTKDAASWFNMSLVSVYGRTVANEKKQQNTLSYQHHLYAMLQQSFKGEPYKIYKPERLQIPFCIGIEATAGHRWPNKTWTGYKVLADQLQAYGYHPFFFERKPSLREYMAEISSCSLVISGDTLAMHLAMAYEIPVLALFNCTSPNEIYDYPWLHKMISPLLADFYYSTGSDSAATSAIPVESVMQAFRALWTRFYVTPNQIMEHV